MAFRGIKSACLIGLIGCAHVPPPPGADECATRCGLIGVRLDCAELQTLEDAALTAYARHVPGWRPELLCTAVRGWRIRVHEYSDRDLKCVPGGWMSLDVGKCIRGYAFLEERELEIDHLRPDSSLAHELGHLLEGSGHCRWTERGVKAALFEATSQPDSTLEVCQ